MTHGQKNIKLLSISVECFHSTNNSSS